MRIIVSNWDLNSDQNLRVVALHSIVHGLSMREIRAAKADSRFPVRIRNQDGETQTVHESVFHSSIQWNYFILLWMLAHFNDLRPNWFLLFANVVF